MQPFVNTQKLIYAGFVAIVSITAFGITSCKHTATIHTEGIYQSQKDGDAYEYLRFFPDGNVITVSSTGSPADMAKLFIENAKGVSKGNYTITGTQIKFSSKDSVGVVDYEGDIVGDHLSLKTYSHINGYRGKDEYQFIKN